MRITITAIAVGLSLLVAVPASAAGPGDLLKLACPAGSGSDHYCRAVYYWGADGKRHAFPNSQTYFSWYADFAGVKTVTAAEMASLPLGRNVTYRPGSRLVKLQTDPKVYAVDAGGALRWVASESVAIGAYGTEWNVKVDDLSDAFFPDYRTGSPISSATEYSPAARLAAAPTIDADSGATSETRSITTGGGTFSVQVVTLARERFSPRVLAATTADCANGCAAKPLAEYAKSVGAGIGIHGSYFCPPDYADCAAKTYSFLWPLFDSSRRGWVNEGNIKFHEAPIVAMADDGTMTYFRRANAYASAAELEAAFGRPIAGAFANYPGLADGGASVVASEPRLEESQRTVKGTRAAFGFDAGRMFLVVAKNATVVDLADIMLALGAAEALNLDGGGSTALYYGGTYLAGPGRLLPNALVFVPR